MSDKKKKVSEEVIQSKKCFFITPIGDPKSNEFEKLEGLIDNVLNPVLTEKGYDIIVAHTIQSLGSINDQIFKNIIESDLVISNLTGLNANVMYETAVAHSYGKPTIMISESGTNLPFDLKTDRTIFFNDSIKGTGLLKEEIIKKITQLESDSNTDNPIVRVIQISKLSEQLSKETLSEDETIMKMILDLSKKVDKLDKDTYDHSHTIMPTLNNFRVLFSVNKKYLDNLDLRINQLKKYNGIIEANLIKADLNMSPENINSKFNVYLELLTYIDNELMIRQVLESCFEEIFNFKLIKTSD